MQNPQCLLCLVSIDIPLSRCLLVLFSLLLTLLTVAELTLVVLLQLKVCAINDHFIKLFCEFKNTFQGGGNNSVGVHRRQADSKFLLIWIICLIHHILLAKIMVR